MHNTETPITEKEITSWIDSMLKKLQNADVSQRTIDAINKLIDKHEYSQRFEIAAADNVLVDVIVQE